MDHSSVDGSTTPNGQGRSGLALAIWSALTLTAAVAWSDHRLAAAGRLTEFEQGMLSGLAVLLGLVAHATYLSGAGRTSWLPHLVSAVLTFVPMATLIVSVAPNDGGLARIFLAVIGIAMVSAAILLDRRPALPMEQHETSESATEWENDPAVRLWMTRREEADGRQLVEGVVSVTFHSGQATAHIPIIPPFPTAPIVQCDVLDADDVRVKPAFCLPYGVRLDVTRRARSTSRDCRIGFSFAYEAKRDAA